MSTVAVGTRWDLAGLPLPPAGPPEGARPVLRLADDLCAEMGDPVSADIAALVEEDREATRVAARRDARLAALYLWGAAEFAARCDRPSDAARREWGARAMLTELAVALRVPETTLARRLTRITMAQRFGRFDAAHAAGTVSSWHVDVMLDVFRGVDDPAVLARADAALVEKALWSTATELRAAARRWRARHVPRTDEQRARNLADRHVAIAPADEDLVWLTALIPAAAGVAIDHRLSDLAAAVAVAPDERRTGDQLRADVLMDLLLGAVRAPSGPRAVEEGGGRDAGDVARDDRADAGGAGAGGDATDVGGSDAGAGRAGGWGHGADRADPAVGSDDGDRADDGDPAGSAGRGVGGDRAGRGVDGATTGVAGEASGVPGWVLGVRPEIVLTVPVLSLLGRGDEPAELEGFGPIDIETARTLCASAPSFTRVLTHPETGAVLSVSRDRYRIPADLRRAVRLRDRTCRFPGCRRRARRCDIDHSTAWPAGRTGLCNLACLCRKHHRLKHEMGWRVEHRGDGVLDWTSPTGLRYATEPGTRWPPPPRPAAARSTPAGGDPPTARAGSSGYPDDPPF